MAINDEGFVAVTAEELAAAVESSMSNMREIMMTSIAYNTETTAITTLLGQNANRASKQTPQG